MARKDVTQEMGITIDLGYNLIDQLYSFFGLAIG